MLVGAVVPPATQVALVVAFITPYHVPTVVSLQSAVAAVWVEVLSRISQQSFVAAE